MDSGGQALSFSIKRKNSVRRTDMQDAFSRMELLVGNTGVKNSAGRKLQYSVLAEPDHRWQSHLRAVVWGV